MHASSWLVTEPNASSAPLTQAQAEAQCAAFHDCGQQQSSARPLSCTRVQEEWDEEANPHMFVLSGALPKSAAGQQAGGAALIEPFSLQLYRLPGSACPSSVGTAAFHAALN